MRPPLGIDRVEVFKGPGSRVKRVHVFAKRGGHYLTCGYIKARVLFTRVDVVLAAISVRRSHGRA
jgi:hypothetical protein